MTTAHGLCELCGEGIDAHGLGARCGMFSPPRDARTCPECGRYDAYRVAKDRLREAQARIAQLEKVAEAARNVVTAFPQECGLRIRELGRALSSLPAPAPTSGGEQAAVRRGLLKSMTPEEFAAYKGPTEDEMRDAMERGRRAAAAAGHRLAAQCPRRTLPEDAKLADRLTGPNNAAAEVCACGHGRDHHDDPGSIEDRGCWWANDSRVLCPCRRFTPAAPETAKGGAETEPDDLPTDIATAFCNAIERFVSDRVCNPRDGVDCINSAVDLHGTMQTIVTRILTAKGNDE